MLKNWKRTFSLLGVIASLSVINLSGASAQNPAEVRMSFDDLDTVFGLPWAADNWPFGQVIEIQRNSVDPTVVGRIVLDRHGLDADPLIKAPFASPYPGRVVLISGWASLTGGCLAELVIQVAVAEDELDASVLIPTEMSMNINGQVITLPSLEDSASYSDVTAFNYVETVWDESTEEYVNIDKVGVWYTARHLFSISAANAAVLSQATAENTDLRIVLSNRRPFTYPIGESTTGRWRNVFSFNPSCSGTSATHPVLPTVADADFP